MASNFSIYVAKEYLKFSAAHFIAYAGFREPLHGHNYQVSVKIEGRLDSAGYVLDFGLIKRLLKQIVDPLDERTIIPARSDCLKLEHRGRSLLVRYEDDEFIFPFADVALLDIVHSSAEELARLISDRLLAELGVNGALKGLQALEVAVAESPGQAATYRSVLTPSEAS
jgi:6-pyruvoyltetrahydropterin/6-carboxytetrahydropterin synthase